LGGPLPKLCPAFQNIDQDGRHSRTFSLVAILVGSWDHRTQFWKRAIQGPFHQSLVEIGSVVSEEKIFINFMQIRKKGDEIKKNSSPLKLLSHYTVQIWALSGLK
jgi:hypothetical protein